MKKLILSILLFGMASNHAVAGTECLVNISRLYVGDETGILWMEFKNGGSAHIVQTDINFKNIYSLVLSAKMAEKSIIVRFNATGIVCNADHRDDIKGVWLP